MAMAVSASVRPLGWCAAHEVRSPRDLGKTFLDGVRQHAADNSNNNKLDGVPANPNLHVPPENILTVLRSAARAPFLCFPQLAPTSTG